MSSLNPRSLLTLHVGQAGLQIGHAVWELMCLEHNILPDGSPKPECGDQGNADTIFLASQGGHRTPRSIFVDSDPCCVDELRSGPYRGLFNSRQLLSDHMDSGGNYSTGRFGFYRTLLSDTIDRLRWLIEKADCLPTVCLFHSACGGTGSGFAAACLTRAADELHIGGQGNLDICVVPGRCAIQNSCDLLNTALYLEEAKHLVRQTFCLSNSALYRVCAAQLASMGPATYANANRLLATAFSNLTAPERLPGSSVSMYNILDSLLPFEHLKYPLIACAPFLPATTSGRRDQPTAKSATAAVLEPSSQFLDVDPRHGRHAAGFLLFRGPVSLGDAHRLAAEASEKSRGIRFHDWAPAGFRSGLVTPPPLAPSGSGMVSPAVSVTMVTSHSGVSEVFAKLAESARGLHECDLFVHGYENAIVRMLTRDGFVGGASTSTRHQQELQQLMTPPPASDMGRWLSISSSVDGDASLLQELRHHKQRRCHRQQHQHQHQYHQQQHQGPPEELGSEEAGDLENKRTCALSDVFGVRTRISVAIEYLDRVARLYSEDVLMLGVGSGISLTAGQAEPPPESPAQPQGPKVDDVAVKGEAALEGEGAQGEAGGGAFDGVGEGAESEAELNAKLDNSGNASCWLEHRADGSDESATETRESQRQQGDPLLIGAGHQQQSQLQLSSSLSPTASDESSGETEAAQPTRRSGGGASLFRVARNLAGCLHRKTASSLQVQRRDLQEKRRRQFSWSPRRSSPAAVVGATGHDPAVVDADCDSRAAIVQAERVLLKYRCPSCSPDQL